MRTFSSLMLQQLCRLVLSVAMPNKGAWFYYCCWASLRSAPTYEEDL